MIATIRTKENHLRLVVPGLPPSINHLYFTTEDGKRIMSHEAKLYQEDCKIAALAAKSHGWRWHGSWLRVRIKLYFPDKRRRDTHNHPKVLLDGIADGLGVDDRWMLISEEIPSLDRKDPRVEVTIEEASNDTA